MSEWRPVPWAPIYEASDTGEVRKCPPGKATIRMANARQVSIFGSPVMRDKVVAETWIGVKPEGGVLIHIDGNRENCSPKNLRYVSSGEARSMGLMSAARPVVKYDERGIIKRYCSVKQAARENYMAVASMKSRCAGQLKRKEAVLYAYEEDYYAKAEKEGSPQQAASGQPAVL